MPTHAQVPNATASIRATNPYSPSAQRRKSSVTKLAMEGHPKHPFITRASIERTASMDASDAKANEGAATAAGSAAPAATSTSAAVSQPTVGASDEGGAGTEAGEGGGEGVQCLDTGDEDPFHGDALKTELVAMLASLQTLRWER